MKSIANLTDFCTKKHCGDYSVDQGQGLRIVRYSAWRRTRPNIKGYGMTAGEAIHDLVYNVQPLSPNEAI